MTSREFFARIEAAPEGQRWALADALLPEVDELERELVAAWVGDFICALEPVETLDGVPDGVDMGPEPR